jgi:hypothetical protein
VRLNRNVLEGPGIAGVIEQDGRIKPEFMAEFEPVWKSYEAKMR